MKKILAVFVLLAIWTLSPAAGVTDVYASGGSGVPGDDIGPPPDQEIVLDSENDEETTEGDPTSALGGGGKVDSAPGGDESDEEHSEMSNIQHIIHLLTAIFQAVLWF